MQAIELMLGDWVFYPKTQEYCKVTTIHNKYLYCFPKGSDEKHSYGLREESVSPIPLTEEILVKNGFEKFAENQTHFDYTDNDIHLEYWIGDGCFMYYTAVIHYVHQLQHALRLCNIEKEIEL